ncbi:MAG: hypothetical protein IRZ03_08270 [Acidobacterium ailaaui]|nr:hypothetical protein [Pseudacidobacterium ailaaui]
MICDIFGGVPSHVQRLSPELALAAVGTPLHGFSLPRPPADPVALACERRYLIAILALSLHFVTFEMKSNLLSPDTSRWVNVHLYPLSAGVNSHHDRAIRPTLRDDD